jgi:hypothetical protein
MCQSVLGALWTITPKRKAHPEIKVRDLPKRMGELREFIEDNVACRHDTRAHKDGRDLPDPNFIDAERFMGRSVEEYIEFRVRSQKETLEKGIETEQGLREQLNDTLSKIREMDGSGENSFVLHFSSLDAGNRLAGDESSSDLTEPAGRFSSEDDN